MSGIYIPGMEMPKSCDTCPFSVFRICLINTLQEGKYCVTHSCPLIPVPDHGRLVDADAMERKLCYGCDACNGDTAACVEYGLIATAPTIIPAEEEEEG